MGLHVWTYRSQPSKWLADNDCTNGGISRDARGLCLVNVEGPFEPDDDFPAAMLVSNNVFGDDVGRRLVKVVPAHRLESGEYVAEGRWTMFGGNFASTCDSRFREAVEGLLGVFASGAVPIHDRIEAK